MPTTRLAPRYIGYVKKNPSASTNQNNNNNNNNNNGNVIVIEAFVDVLCPFSTRAFNTLLELVESSSNQLFMIELRIITLIQPWHAQSTYLTFNVAQASLSINDKEAFRVMKLIMNNQDKYSDEAVSNLTPNQLKNQISQFTGVVSVSDDQMETYERVERLVKNHQKYGRQNGVHMTPAFAINGLLDNEPSSSWTVQQWLDFLAPISPPVK